MAYTFVTPEEGNELTRIEMRIDRLLQRAEMEGFEVVQTPPQPAELLGGAAAADSEPEEPAAEKPAVPKMGRGGRPPRRIRRAL